MKKLLAVLLTLALVLGLSACAAPSDAEPLTKHKIGVAVYDLSDSQVMAFRNYLENYIAASFEDVEFVYSMSIRNQEEAMDFLRGCIDSGVEGILNCNSYDLEKEAALCAENGVYMLCPSSTVAPEMFSRVAQNSYFLGYFGPGPEMEYAAGYDMGKYFASQGYGDSYFLLNGGAPMGNTMHKSRTMGILDALQESYGVAFSRSVEELASGNTVTVTAGDLTVHICGGYLGIPEVCEGAKAFYAANPCESVLSVIPVGELADFVGTARLGIIDCYSEENARLFSAGKLSYVCGKYSSIIGPGFAAMYNAVTGHADAFREQGKAFRIQQGFWTSADIDDYFAKYALSSGIALNAYSVEDLMGVIAEYNPDATLSDLQNLAAAWDFAAAAERRGG